MSDEDDGLSELDLKAKVRERDGFKCRDCGKTQDQHIEETGKILDVHRVIPGMEYLEFWCVTLCRTCHGSKPKTVQTAFWEEQGDVRFFTLNMYNDEDRQLIEGLDSLVTPEDQNFWHDTARRLLYEALKEYRERDRLDLFAQADGLW